jgi:signal transduction histidine kinase
MKWAYLKYSCDRLIGTVNQILDVFRMEVGMMDYRFSERDLPPIIQKIFLELAPPTRRKIWS